MAVAACHHSRSKRKASLISQTEHSYALTAEAEVTEAKQVHICIESASALATNVAVAIPVLSRENKATIVPSESAI